MSTCPSCGTPECFDQYSELLSRSYTIEAYRPVHQLVVDTCIATTVADVLAADDAAHHTKLVWAWASDIWQAWSPHHPTIRTWNAQAL